MIYTYIRYTNNKDAVQIIKFCKCFFFVCLFIVKQYKSKNLTKYSFIDNIFFLNEVLFMIVVLNRYFKSFLSSRDGSMNEFDDGCNKIKRNNH